MISSFVVVNELVLFGIIVVGQSPYGVVSQCVNSFLFVLCLLYFADHLGEIRLENLLYVCNSCDINLRGLALNFTLETNLLLSYEDFDCFYGAC